LKFLQWQDHWHGSRVWRDFAQYLPPDAVKLGLTLALSFLLGIEREQHKAAGAHGTSSRWCRRRRGRVSA
jgi:hypothetical protein